MIHTITTISLCNWKGGRGGRGGGGGGGGGGCRVFHNMIPKILWQCGSLQSTKLQVVSGHKFEITIELGISNSPRCKRLSRNGVVSTKVCDDRENVSIFTKIGHVDK